MKKYLQSSLESLNETEQEEVYFLMAEKLKEQNKSQHNKIKYELISTWQDDITARYKNWGKMIGISTGFRTLDSMTKGLVGGEMIVVAGKTSHGKTSLALNIAEKVAKESPVLFLTLEMTKVEIGARLQAIHGKDLYDLNLLVQVEDEFNWRDIDLLFEQAKKDQVALVIIDHLHYFTRELEHVSEDLGRITKEIKKNAIRHNLPVILISHTRKTNKSNDTFDIEDLRGSSFIAQDSDIVLGVYRSPKYKDSILVGIHKNRNRGFDYDNNETAFDFDGTKITEPLFQ